MNFRFILLVITVFLIFGGLVFNLYDLQIEKGSFYSARASSQYRLSGLLEARRGIIYFTDKNGNLTQVALNKPYPIVYAVPGEIGDKYETSEILAEILKLDSNFLKKKFSREASKFELLAIKLTGEEFKKIKEADLSGVYIDSREFRFYPLESLAAHILGFVGQSSKDDEIKGRYGIEAYFNESLKGKSGHIQEREIIEPLNGTDLNLTIDRNIQAQAEEVLLRTIEKNNAEGGTVIIQEPSTGKILAFANQPSFNPNHYSESNIENFLNPGVQSLYEPGSVFKVLTIAAGMDVGKLSPDTRYYDAGSITLNGKTIKNYKDKIYGSVTMTEVIENSINTGAVFAAKTGGHKNFYNYLVKFGFEGKTGIPLPGEVKSRLNTLTDDYREINYATAAFGQGVAVTPIALINAISAIANNGVLMKPSLLSDSKPQVIRRVIRSETADEVTKMMSSAVFKAEVARINNYNIAGKTGTAQIPDLKLGGYKEEFIHTFVGFAPATDPKFTVLVKIDRPAFGTAAVTVVPAFRELAQFILNYYNIPPDNLTAAK